MSDALRAGAAGFVLKDSPAEELIRAVRIVAEGEAVLDPAITARVLDTYRAAPGRPQAMGGLRVRPRGGQSPRPLITRLAL